MDNSDKNEGKNWDDQFSKAKESIKGMTEQTAGKLAAWIKKERLKNPSIPLNLDQAKYVYEVILDHALDGKEFFCPTCFVKSWKQIQTTRTAMAKMVYCQRIRGFNT